MDENSPDRHPLHIRIPTGMYAEIADFAKRTHRSVNGAANYLLEVGLQASAAEPVHVR